MRLVGDRAGQEPYSADDLALLKAQFQVMPDLDLDFELDLDQARKFFAIFYPGAIFWGVLHCLVCCCFVRSLVFLDLLFIIVLLVF